MPAGSCSASSTRSRPRRYDRRLDSTLPTDRVEWDVRGGGRQEALQEHNGEERRCGSCCLEPWWDVEDRWSPDADAWFSWLDGLLERRWRLDANICPWYIEVKHEQPVQNA